MIETWRDLGKVETLKNKTLQEILVENKKIALTYLNGKFSAVSGVCNHVGGPLGQGRLEGEYIVCPWHQYKFHCRTGQGEPGFEDDQIPNYEVKEENGNLWINLEPITKRHKPPHEPHPLARKIERAPGPIRVVGISTTNMDEKNPRVSTSDELLNTAIVHAKSELGAEIKIIRLSALKFKTCEGYYSKSAQACTWPCSITLMDEKDEMEQVYEAIVHWADVIMIATPIRWGNASSLYYKMVERLNCVQNQITIRNQQLIQNKTVALIITGGQDNIQSVAGQMLTFFSEIGCTFPPFPFIAHSRGWTAEDMDANVRQVLESKDLHDGAKALVKRAIDTAVMVLKHATQEPLSRGGRKAIPLHPYQKS